MVSKARFGYTGARFYGRLGRLALEVGPSRLAAFFLRSPWLESFFQLSRMLRTMTGERQGAMRTGTANYISFILDHLCKLISDAILRPEKLVLHEDLVPPELLTAMGLRPFMAELIGIVLPMVNPRYSERYIDLAENDGFPPDLCSLPKQVLGMAVGSEFPDPAVIVTSNSPCDGGMVSYSMLEEKLGAPTFRLDLPYDVSTERAEDYFVEEIKELITFLETHTPGRYDPARLAEVLEERNIQQSLALDLWDLLREKPAPLAGDVVCWSNLMMLAAPGEKRTTRLLQEQLDLARNNYSKGLGAVAKEKHRAILWNPPPLIFPASFSWAEKKYHTAVVMDMLTFNRHPIVDTSTEASMLKGLARIMMDGPMARHTRGPMENFLSDLFFIYDQFSADMIWMAAHVGCKNTQAALGALREYSREREIPLLIIDYDLSDSRIESKEGIMGQIDDFMENVA